jgi:micrococcal nuclease
MMHVMRRLSIIFLATLTIAACVATPKGIRVARVVDGDTIEVTLSDGAKEKVRIIGIDTPEIVDPRKPVQCFGHEASARMKELVDGRAVELQKNPSEDRDKYGRLLRYIDLEGDDIGAQMIREGYAFSYKAFAHPRLEQYNALERDARNAKRGLWGPACGGRR